MKLQPGLDAFMPPGNESGSSGFFYSSQRPCRVTGNKQD